MQAGPDIENRLQEIAGAGAGAQAEQGQGGAGVTAGNGQMQGGLEGRDTAARVEGIVLPGAPTESQGGGGWGRDSPCVDEEYVHALEMYCLLKQRLFDVRHNWRMVLKKALSSDHGKYTGKSLTHI